jgi:hypothetical protein
MKSYKGLLLLVMLLSVTARVFTGASEAQINFTSLIVDQNLHTDSSVDHYKLLHEATLENSEGASSIPDKHRTFSTYKKYIPPDKSLQMEIFQTKRKAERSSPVQFVSLYRTHNSIYLPVANAPPAVVSALSPTHTTTTGSPVATENYFGEIAIDNSSWGLGRLKL